MKIGKYWYYLCKNCKAPRRRKVSYPSQRGKEPKFCPRKSKPVFWHTTRRHCQPEYFKKIRNEMF